nr:hypothetical protein [uncultured Draconibacterium sp.]
MNLKEKYQKWNKRRKVKKAMRRMNRNVTRAKVIYAILIYGGILGFIYGVTCIFTGWPWIYAFTPLWFIIGAFVLKFLNKNWKLIWLYARDMEQGRLLLFLNDNTVWSHEHKMKVVKWVYLRRKTIRNEHRLSLNERIRNGIKLTEREKIEMRYKSVFCPQQMQDGVNKAFLVNALIYAHRYIQPLDDNLRKIMQLTDDNMQKFDLNKEIDRCRKDKASQENDRLLEIGRKRSKKLNGSN